MFSDPTTAFMSMLLLFFIGMVIMFFATLRSIQAARSETKEMLRKQQAFLADLERQIMEMSFSLRALHDGAPAARQGTGVAGASLARQPVAVSGAANAGHEEESILSLLEASGKAKGSLGGTAFDDHVLPPAKGRTILDAYPPRKEEPPIFTESFLASGPSDRKRVR